MRPLLSLVSVGGVVGDRQWVRPAESYVHGEHGVVVMVPGRVAAWLERKCGLSEQRVMARGIDAEVDAVLMALHLASLQWRSAATGTDNASSAEPPASSAAWLTTTQAAGLLGITDRAVRKAIGERRLDATRVGNAWQVSRESVEHFRAQRSAA